MKFIAIDFEATDKIPETARPTEIAVVMCEVMDGEEGVLIQRVAQVSSLIYDPEYPPQSDEVLEVTGITDEMLKEDGRAFHVIMTELQLLGKPDFFLAHNKGYDEEILAREISRWADRVGPEDKQFYEELINTPWICTMRDIEHPQGSSAESFLTWPWITACRWTQGIFTARWVM